MYDFAIQIAWLTMKDGVRLSATLFQPLAKSGDTAFPAILEMLPYRKDDSFYLRDYPIYSYFARRGFIMVKVDVRGTGSSEGTVPPREYSQQELDDAVDCIRQLAALPECNGRVGMWGISWGGFNAIQVAMRQPPHLHAIAAFHASDDLFHDDVRFLDGIFHVNAYALEIDHELGLPATPHYTVDAAYFRDRFEAYPWFLTYAKQQRDGSFWRQGSLRFQYEALQVPTYLVAGLLDGYRDTVPRVLAGAKVPLKAEIGPWNHDFPDTGKPGPNYEWRENLAAFWNFWLKGKRSNAAIMSGPPLTMFVRSGHAPNAHLSDTPGKWRREHWPPARRRLMRWFPASGGQLLPKYRNRGPGCTARLAYVPTAGVEAGRWWGEPTGDMSGADAHSLVFDSEPLQRAACLAGFAKVRFKASVDAPVAHFVVRLEDVDAEGRVSLVTGAALNGSQRVSRLEPTALEPGQVYDFELDLHFTTWTFRSGHRIRLAVSNCQFPMIWPTPHSMTMSFVLDGSASLELPCIPASHHRGKRREEPAQLPPPQDREHRTDAREVKSHLCSSGKCCFDRQERDRLAKKTTVRGARCQRFQIGNRLYRLRQATSFWAMDDAPARSGFHGTMTTEIDDLEASWRLRLETTIRVRSDARYFHCSVKRKLSRNGLTLRQRIWREKIPRDFN